MASKTNRPKNTLLGARRPSISDGTTRNQLNALESVGQTATVFKGIRIKIPTERLLEELPKVFSKKLVVAFEDAYSKDQAQCWIETFNESSKTKLLFIDSLLNSLFIAEVVEDECGTGHDELLNKTYGKAGGRFATFNSYQTAFNPQWPIDFHYLMSVLIKKGAKEYLTFLKEILEPIGRVVDREVSGGSEQFKIIALVVTSLRSFERSAIVEFENGKEVLIAFEYYHPFARCEKCFVIEHVASTCSAIVRQPTIVRPTLVPPTYPCIEVHATGQAKICIPAPAPSTPTILQHLIVQHKQASPTTHSHTSVEPDTEERFYRYYENLQDQAAEAEEVETREEELQADITRSQILEEELRVTRDSAIREESERAASFEDKLDPGLISAEELSATYGEIKSSGHRKRKHQQATEEEDGSHSNLEPSSRQTVAKSMPSKHPKNGSNIFSHRAFKQAARANATKKAAVRERRKRGAQCHVEIEVLHTAPPLKEAGGRTEKAVVGPGDCGPTESVNQPTTVQSEEIGESMQSKSKQGEGGRR